MGFEQHDCLIRNPYCYLNYIQVECLRQESDLNSLWRGDSSHLGGSFDLLGGWRRSNLTVWDKVMFSPSNECECNTLIWSRRQWKLVTAVCKEKKSQNKGSWNGKWVKTWSRLFCLALWVIASCHLLLTFSLGPAFISVGLMV